MALYVVLHHQQDEKQIWVNAWLNDQLIEAIQTTNEIGGMCCRAKERSERVYVHRCGWQEWPPAICCSAEVEEVASVDDSTMLVRFANPAPLNGAPLRVPVKGQNFYAA